MGRVLRLCGLAIGLLGCAAGASGHSTGAPGRETPYSGVVARLPFVGTLTWRCDEQRRFFTRLALPRPGATVFVSLNADGRRVWRRRRVDPRGGRERTVVGPFRAVRRQTWTIRYHHAPATLRVVARLRFSAPPSRAQCVVARASIEIARTPH